MKALENPVTLSSSSPTTTSTTTAAAPSVPFSSGGGAFQDVEASRIRQIIAQNTTASKQNVPHYYLTIELELESLLNLRAHLNENTSDDTKISVNDFIVKASALACKAVRGVVEFENTFLSDIIFQSHISHFRCQRYSKSKLTLYLTLNTNYNHSKHRYRKSTPRGSRKRTVRMSYEHTNTWM